MYIYIIKDISLIKEKQQQCSVFEAYTEVKHDKSTKDLRVMTVLIFLMH